MAHNKEAINQIQNIKHSMGQFTWFLQKMNDIFKIHAGGASGGVTVVDFKGLQSGNNQMQAQVLSGY